MRRALFVAALCGGCVRGGGPLIGYGAHSGVFWGAEATGGLAFPVQAVAGFQSSPGVGYLRADATWDFIGSDPIHSPAVGMRIGGGIGLEPPASGGVHGMFVASAAYGQVVKAGSCVPEARVSGYAVVGWLDIRYLSEWQVVLSPRFEVHEQVCPGH